MKRILSALVALLLFLNSAPLTAVSSRDQDITLTDFDIDQSVFDLHESGDQLAVSLSLSDIGNLKKVRVQLYRKDYKQKRRERFQSSVYRPVNVSGNSQAINLKIDLPKKMESGIWFLKVLIFPKKGRVIKYLKSDLDELGFPSEIQINSKRDNLAPQILELEFPDMVSVYNGATSLDLDVKVFDVSGIDKISAKFLRPKAKKNLNKKTLVANSVSAISSNGSEFQHRLNIDFTEDKELGAWYLKLMVKDGKGHKKVYKKNALDFFKLKNKTELVDWQLPSETTEDNGDTTTAGDNGDVTDTPVDNGDTSNGDVIDTPVSDEGNDDTPPPPPPPPSDNEPDPPPPPDPELSAETLVEAPELDAGNQESAVENVDFLISGNNPIQTGIDPKILDRTKQAIVRGKVFDTEGNPLKGARVTIKNHNEFGQTYTLKNGEYNLVLNGGKEYTLNITKPGYLHLQRSIDVPKRDFAILDDVILTHLSSRAKTIVFGNNGSSQVTESETYTDADGSRKATVIFPSDVHAQIELENGHMMNVNSGNFRITEYTVGENGESAMPGPLPATSGYTYAVEFSLDEAIANNSDHVVFDKAIPFYVDNFLDFPVGELVPLGYYDREKSAWIPEENGIIIKIIGVDNGKALISTSDDDSIANQGILDKLGFTQDELIKLASLYPIGTELWRVMIDHFSSYDCNWGMGPQPDAINPPDEAPENEDENNPADPNTDCNSIIMCESQVLGESVNVTSTPFTLEYRSDRVKGRSTSRRIVIPVIGSNVPASLKKIVVTVDVAGKRHKEIFEDIEADTKFVYEWNGKDVYGREVIGSINAYVNVSYEYQGSYFSARSDVERSFAQASIDPLGSGSRVIGNRETAEIKLERDYIKVVSNNALEKTLGFGAWSLSEQHFYEPNSKTLYRGDGTIDTPQNETLVLEDRFEFSGALFNDFKDVVIDEEGNLYAANYLGSQILKIDLQNNITILAGNGDSTEDGVLALNSRADYPSTITLDKEGNIYFASTVSDHRVRKIDMKTGLISTVAGTGSLGSLGDGGKAVDAAVSGIRDIEFGSDGSLYILTNLQIRKVDINGIITTIAGKTRFDGQLDGYPAVGASVTGSDSIFITKNDEIIIANSLYNKIRKIDQYGIINTIAGTGDRGYEGDGDQAIDAKLNRPTTVRVDKKGNIYFYDSGNNVVRRIKKNGVINTIAGNGESKYNNKNKNPLDASFYSFETIQFDNNDNLYIIDYSMRARKLRSSLPDFNEEGYRIPSADGSEYYDFDANGKHLATFNALTGVKTFEFQYDTEGYLEKVIDSNGETISIERTSDNEISIVNPEGLRTNLELTGKYLTQITDPMGGSVSMTYSDKGLMKTFTNKRGFTSNIEYGKHGRLKKDTTEFGSSFSFDRDIRSRGFSVEMKSAMGRTKKHNIRYNDKDEYEQKTTKADDTVKVLTIKKNHTKVLESSDGTKYTTAYSADPRFAMTSPYPSKAITKLPSGMTSTVEAVKKASLINGDIFNPSSLTTETSFNGRKYKEVYDTSTRELTNTSPEGREATIVLDDEGKISEIRKDGLASTFYNYDANGRVASITKGIGANGRTTNFSYDSNGFLTSIQDALGKESEYIRDKLGNVTKETTNGGIVYDYAYDPNQNLTGLDLPNAKNHNLGYNSIDLLNSYIAPATSDSGTRSYDYNLDKELDLVTREDGSTIDYEYNGKGQLKSISTEDGTYSMDYYNKTGKLKTSSTPDLNSINFKYDGFLLTKEDLDGEIDHDVKFIYDNDFRVRTLMIDNANDISYEFDDDGLVTKAGDLEIHNKSINSLIESTNLDLITTNFAYNDFAEPIAYKAEYNGSALYQVVYKRDKLGRVTEKLESVSGSTKKYSYTYDQEDRLSTVSINDSLVRSYGYDSNDNRVSVNNINLAQYDEQDRLLSYDGTSYNYNPNGELVSKTKLGQTTSYDYDAFGNLESVDLLNSDSIEYVIDARGRRVGKKINGSLVQGLIYKDQLEPIAETDGAGNIVSEFIYGVRPNVPDYMIKAGKKYRIISDNVGSVRLVVDSFNGSITQRIDYDEFGNVILDTNPRFQPFGFAGGIYDRDTELTLFGARNYDPETGRWISKDPILFSGGQANFYIYIGSDSINSFDRNGLARVGSGPITLAGGISFGPRGYISHSHIFFDDGSAPSNYGFGPNGEFTEDSYSRDDFNLGDRIYDDDLMREAVENTYGGEYCLISNNCHDYKDDVLDEYERLKEKRFNDKLKDILSNTPCK